ncbi:MAG: metallophosphoesterase [Erysipelotrichaceae bacterium]
MKFICMVLCIVLVGCSPNKLPEVRVSEQPLRIVVASDLHYLSPRIHDHGAAISAMMEAGDGKLSHYGDLILASFVTEMLELQPDVVILSGDMTLDGEIESHEDLMQAYTVLEQAGIAVLVLPGNHDVDTPFAAAYKGNSYDYIEAMTHAGFQKAYREFGIDLALSKDKETFSYIVPLRSDVWVLLVDTNTLANRNKVSDETLAWMEKVCDMASAANAKLIGVSHQNLLQHSSLFKGGFVISNAQAIIDLYTSHEFLVNLAGHLHPQHIEEGEIVEILTQSMGLFHHTYGVIDYDGSTLSYQANALDIESWVQTQGYSEPHLLDFNQFGQTFFDLAASSGLEEQLLYTRQSKDNRDVMLSFFQTLNRAYFSGTIFEIDETALSYQLWQEPFDEMAYYYVQSMLESTSEQHRYYEIKAQ